MLLNINFSNVIECKEFQYPSIVFLSILYAHFPARNESLEQQAVKDLNGEGLHPKFHQLDLTDKASCEKLKTFLQSNYGGLDILVNNAGMCFKVSYDNLSVTILQVTIYTY